MAVQEEGDLPLQNMYFFSSDTCDCSFFFLDSDDYSEICISLTNVIHPKMPQKRKTQLLFESYSWFPDIQS